MCEPKLPAMLQNDLVTRASTRVSADACVYPESPRIQAENCNRVSTMAVIWMSFAFGEETILAAFTSFRVKSQSTRPPSANIDCRTKSLPSETSTASTECF